MKLKLFKEIPPKGLAVFNGAYESVEGKEIKVNLAFEPPKPLTRALYMCDDQFHTEHLRAQLHVVSLWAVIIVDGKGASWYSLDGQNKTRLFKVSVDLPPKHGRGGQSANRFARLREERRLWYIKKVMEISQRVLVGDNHLVNFEGIILAGSADLKNDLFSSPFLDPRIKSKIKKVVDIQYGGEPGLQEVLTTCEEALKDQRILKEREAVSLLFQTIASEGPCAFTLQDTIFALESGAVETLIISDSLATRRLKLSKGELQQTLFLEENEQVQDEFSSFSVVEQGTVLEWLLTNYKSFGVDKINVVSRDTAEGTQFWTGFGGLGALLRYPLELPSQTHLELDEPFEDDDTPL